LLINDVVEFSLFLLHNVFFIIVLVVIIVVLFVIEILLWLLCIQLISLHVKLVKNVLDLPFELFITLLHQILQDFRHP
jgi:hypothetical protein